MKYKLISHATLFLFLLPLLPASASEIRCGWFENPTPSNAWFTDKGGEWLISSQGGKHPAQGDWPSDFSAGEWVQTNGHYGYGCACRKVDTEISDANHRKIIKIYDSWAKPLSACRNDPNLKKRKL